VHTADGLSRGLFGEAPPLGGQPQAPEGPIPAQPTAPAPVVNYPKVLEGKSGWLYLGDEIASHCNLSKPLDQTMAELDRLRDGVRASGRQFVVVVAPDKTTIAPEYLPVNYAGKDCRQRTAAEFWQRADADNAVLDLRSGIEAQGRAVGAPVYGPQDAHWSDEGGMLMARSLAEAMSPGSTASWVIRPGDPWQLAADLPPLIGHTGQTSGRHYEVLTDGKRDQTREVLSDLKAPLKLQSASGTGTYQGPVALLGDSFTYRALPYLAATFGEMTAQHHSALLIDTGKSVGKMFADNRVVAIEVAERTLASGTFGLLAPQVVDNILAELAARPIR
jgi:alginate O-acetyltransferase complex protein AlgJ